MYINPRYIVHPKAKKVYINIDKKYINSYIFPTDFPVGLSAPFLWLKKQKRACRLFLFLVEAVGRQKFFAFAKMHFGDLGRFHITYRQSLQRYALKTLPRSVFAPLRDEPGFRFPFYSASKTK